MTFLFSLAFKGLVGNEESVTLCDKAASGIVPDSIPIGLMQLSVRNRAEFKIYCKILWFETELFVEDATDIIVWFVERANEDFQFAKLKYQKLCTASVSTLCTASFTPPPTT